MASWRLTKLHPGSGVGRHRSRFWIVASVFALVGALFVGIGSSPAGAVPITVDGTVDGGSGGLADYEVTLWATNGTDAPVQLASDTSDGSGAFSLAYDSMPDSNRILYVKASSGATTSPADAVVLASVLGPEPIQTSITVTPITTVGTAYGMAQFTEGGDMSGASPGLQNAYAMTTNVLDPVTGGVGATVTDSANTGYETLGNINALANMIAACIDSDAECAGLFTAATPVAGTAPANTFDALDNVVHDPKNNAGDLYTQSTAGPTPYTPARGSAPESWTIALRFEGDGQTVAGPGNFALDHLGTVWTLNNYEQNLNPAGPACSSNQLLRFGPDGQFYPGSPYTGGGVSGAGYGITIDPYGDIWTGNFGFASTNCTEYTPHDSVSQFRADGTPVSPDATGNAPGDTGGYIVGGIEWPQGTVSDDEGNIWIANCMGNSVTMLPGGDPTKAKEFDDLGVKKPFDIAFDAEGNAFVTGTESDNVVKLDPEGNLLKTFPGFSRPMGIISNSQGEQWVSNSRLIDLPCPDKNVNNEADPSVANIDANDVVTTYTGGGVWIPWGITVDGDDNVWVANFGRQRLSAFCGKDGSTTCPAGAGKGTPLSPDDGFAYDGLVRNTGVMVDTAGNVWLANNWKLTPPPTNPAGFQVVVYLGLATPVTPPEPIERPTPEPEPGPTPAVPIAARPDYTG